MTLADKLRAALSRPAAEPPIEGDQAELRAAASVPAAVLVAITDRAQPGLILNVRREHMRTHAGQVAFPGGRIDPGEDAIAAALREAQEEILLDPGVAEVIAATREAWATGDPGEVAAAMLKRDPLMLVAPKPLDRPAAGVEQDEPAPGVDLA